VGSIPIFYVFTKTIFSPSCNKVARRPIETVPWHAIETMPSGTSSELNVVNLLHMIRAMCLKHDETKQGIMSAVNSDIRFYTSRQGKDMSCDEYLKLFRAQVDTINAHGGRA